MSQPNQTDAGEGRASDGGRGDIALRQARASGRVRMRAETLRMIRNREVAKGDVLEAARLAGVLAAKRAGDLIPLCPPLRLDAVEVAFDFPDERTIALEAIARATARSGVEMEALAAVAVAALTICDMCMGVDQAVVVEQVRLEEESGGQGGHFVRPT
jgi:cyclic pyranopterin monophosphate synthase